MPCTRSAPGRPGGPDSTCADLAVGPGSALRSRSDRHVPTPTGQPHKDFDSGRRCPARPSTLARRHMRCPSPWGPTHPATGSHTLSRRQPRTPVSRVCRENRTAGGAASNHPFEQLSWLKMCCPRQAVRACIAARGSQTTPEFRPPRIRDQSKSAEVTCGALVLRWSFLDEVNSYARGGGCTCRCTVRDG